MKVGGGEWSGVEVDGELERAGEFRGMLRRRQGEIMTEGERMKKLAATIICRSGILDDASR